MKACESCVTATSKNEQHFLFLIEYVFKTGFMFILNKKNMNM